MARKLIIDGNAVYEIDEQCMLKKRIDQPDGTDLADQQDRNSQKEGIYKENKWTESTHEIRKNRG